MEAIASKKNAAGNEVVIVQIDKDKDEGQSVIRVAEINQGKHKKLIDFTFHESRGDKSRIDAIKSASRVLDIVTKPSDKTSEFAFEKGDENER
ncbi:hypothetical protein A6M27_10720 [Acidithiobacillus thiooxidans]|uniref:Uncharacterized protein n=1 Tax=Acidithiobacillus thiooxidans TaxID=930 RepID=A0A1C2JFY4_ACITH|nr:hypothetical protein [Acidithiobacillus thiooxidans]OCX69245.1 hypothetical protein A6O24_18905 [Acidithiobacillus thiooxidans]OCX71836.1 hypothetical protein A6P07_11245 [Acidithiobacillus thiooxidans]OCX76804.1 hypothetical protein A6O26_20695 [Acidithiobacillus thiooxidans]OCX87148.1 hypothetical protein A6M27_10720 [Acidithiobacillus thiooxidans]OFC49627.1 hypothetical protein BAE47_04700 [Acidithiobacillus thiooxidans]